MTITPRNMFEQHLQTPIEFNTLDELMKLPLVERKKTVRENFHQFSISGKKLMVEYDEGKTFFIVGFLSDTIEGLPKWIHP